MREPKQESWGTFFYNSSEGTVLGRTGISWAKIGGFYLVFYSFLAAFFAVTMAIFYQTLDTVNTPTYTPGEGGGSILKNVALGYRPLSPVVESTLIWVSRNNNQTMNHWIENLDDLVEPYWNRTENVSYVECSDAKGPGENEVCDFNLEKLGPNCKRGNWGYKEGKPCILLKLNKMINWVPQVYQNATFVDTDEKIKAEMPDRLKGEIKQGFEGGAQPQKIWLSCEGKYPEDQDTIGEFQLHPGPSFEGYYFPYTNKKGYLAPLVALELKNPQPNVVINIECKLWADNIKRDRSMRFGLIDFEVIVD